MQSDDFYNWLINERKQSIATAQSRKSNCERICRYCGDIDMHYKNDKCQSLLAAMEYTVDDERNGIPPKHHIPIKGNIKIKIDPTNNATAKKVIQNATGYKINSNIFNYQCSHIWGHTKNPLLF